ncbi:MAG: hypothetical protein GY866_36160 [Proteobacteria bacterium]|nr:hypothetical protein [Pseudomonadota bacterium]
MISRMDHVSIAVKDYEKARRFFQDVLGVIPGTSGSDDAIKYFWHVFSVGDLSRIEIIAPTEEGSFLDNFLAGRKEGGVHHINLETSDIRAVRDRLEEKDIPYFGYNDASDRWKELFIHPKDAYGILIQIAQFRPDDYLAASEKFSQGKRWEVEGNERGCTLSLAHPGGGKVNLELSREEAKQLMADLEKAC